MNRSLLCTAMVSTILAAIGGCAAEYTEPTLPPDHPANPGAAEAPPAVPSRTLELAPPTPRAPASGEGGHDHRAPQTPLQASALYVCPMHPDVTSDKPDQRCPKCGMKLVRRAPEGGRP